MIRKLFVIGVLSVAFSGCFPLNSPFETREDLEPNPLIGTWEVDSKNPLAVYFPCKEITFEKSISFCGSGGPAEKNTYEVRSGSVVVHGIYAGREYTAVYNVINRNTISLNFSGRGELQFNRIK
ncbi:hypothetical protein [Mastigocoleus testarum]|uniref:Lipocalin-like domain-containing protein n=1 Tax=Mastigocoleus testarum BC008 TaxID=371196 RepID=A0A0V7ZIQ9_9CYAN|nr:hypothetical protein [Mastigocoleus testarum]KST64453.1 hypothetical protein BC008_17635 [Mastigocoleus testarum BC008]KST67782.1 hypothetical protein BC008_44355 [Mastigocoleus testarum BC008]